MHRLASLILLALSLGAPLAQAQKVELLAGGEATKLNSPFGVDRGPDGVLYIVEYSHRIRTLDASGKVGTFCGDGTKGDSGDNGPADKASLNAPHAIAVGADNALYIADTLNHRIRRVDLKTRQIATFAGNSKGFSGDGGPAAKAQFSGIYCIGFNPDRSLLVITDLDNRRIRVMDVKAGTVKTIAGNGQRGVPADGAIATEAPLVDPRAAAMDSRGNVYILERGGHALRVVDAAGKIRTLLSGPAVAKDPSELRGPKHLVIDANNDVIIADTDHHRIVKWLAKEAKLTVLAGTGKVGSAGIGGPPDKLQLNQPHGVFLDSDGSLIISDSMNNRVVRIK